MLKSLIIGEMNIKTTGRYYAAPTKKWLFLKNQNKMKPRQQQVLLRMWRNWNGHAPRVGTGHGEATVRNRVVWFSTKSKQAIAL